MTLGKASRQKKLKPQRAQRHTEEKPTEESYFCGLCEPRRPLWLCSFQYLELRRLRTRQPTSPALRSTRCVPESCSRLLTEFAPAEIRRPWRGWSAHIQCSIGCGAPAKSGRMRLSASPVYCLLRSRVRQFRT